MLQRFRADRAFDQFDAGQEVELDPSDEQHARWINTGYLEPLEDAPADDEEGPGTPDVGTPDAGESGAEDGAVGTEGATGAGPKSRSGRRG